MRAIHGPCTEHLCQMMCIDGDRYVVIAVISLMTLLLTIILGAYFDDN